MEKDMNLPEGITQSMVKEWKKHYSGVFIYKTTDGKFCILRSPDLQILDVCRTISKGNSLKFDQALVENCWLAGNDELKAEDKYKMGLFDWLGGIIKKVEGELEEL